MTNWRSAAQWSASTEVLPTEEDFDGAGGPPRRLLASHQPGLRCAPPTRAVATMSDGQAGKIVGRASGAPASGAEKPVPAIDPSVIPT
jgi:hypothetical protein